MRGVRYKSKKCWKPEKTYHFGEKNQSMRNVYKEVEKWKILELDENSKERKKNNKILRCCKDWPQFPLQLLNCIISVSLDDILARVLRD